MIRAAARLLSSAVRSSDVLARCGGDEFVILANNCDAAQLGELTRRIESAVQNQPVLAEVSETEQLELPVSLSLGAASSDETEEAEILGLADRRMYAHKQRFYQSGPAREGR